MTAFRERPSIRLICIFVMHQLTGTWGIALLASFLSRSSLGLAQSIGRLPFLTFLHRLFAYSPYFPIQIALGLYTGWLLRRQFDHRSMLWIWVIPLLILGYVLVAVPTLLPDFTSGMTRSGVNQNPLSHYLGHGCQPSDGCLDQTLVTMPFYASVAYSLGACLAGKMPNRPKVGDLKVA